MRRLALAFALNLVATVRALLSEPETHLQRPLSSPNLSPTAISPSLFTDLERLARLVDITYCVGTSGIYQPFTCASRCKEFPNLRLASTWNTGVLLSDSCGYIAVDDGQAAEDGVAEPPAIIVAFRGTYSLANTVVDLSTVPQEYVPYPDPGEGGGGRKNQTGYTCVNCTVHMGFLESWKQARKLVLPVLQSARAAHPDYPVHVVGHSLGGAVACLAALEMRLALGWEDVMVTTFGEPQAGNAGFVEFVDEVFELVEQDAVDDLVGREKQQRQYRRVTHAGDPVPLLPLSEWGYRAHGGEVFITKASLSPGREDLRMCEGDEDPSCVAGSGEGLLGVPTRFALWQLLFAHRDYFWRLGLCVPGGDPSDWGRPPYNAGRPDEL